MEEADTPALVNEWVEREGRSGDKSSRSGHRTQSVGRRVEAQIGAVDAVYGGRVLAWGAAFFGVDGRLS